MLERLETILGPDAAESLVVEKPQDAVAQRAVVVHHEDVHAAPRAGVFFEAVERQKFPRGTARALASHPRARRKLHATSGRASTLRFGPNVTPKLEEVSIHRGIGDTRLEIRDTHRRADGHPLDASAGARGFPLLPRA